MKSAALVDAMIRDAAETASRHGDEPASQEAAINGYLRVELIRALDALASSPSRAAKQHLASLEREYAAPSKPSLRKMLVDKGYTYRAVRFALDIPLATLSRVLNGQKVDPALLKQIEALPALKKFS